ncbi:aminopeptidase N-like [Microplitis mediator]|uniref:aminopeptidase N-like n=1 Tax=Microplitis mediator TaxID=375433 RepID=UPI002556E68D|nr:aminopeptidase N-like [Microplitis mediator]
MLYSSAGEWIALLLLLLLNKETTDATSTNGTIEYRLPKDVIPISYEVKLTPHILEGNFTFDGLSRVHFNLLRESSSITLHAHNTLKIDQVSTNLTYANGTNVKPKLQTRINETDFLILDFEQPIEPGNYSLTFKYVGNISSVPVGVYRSLYLNDKNEKVWLVATRFSPTKARRAFPCWDEPEYKSIFNLSLNHYKNYTAVSNMPISSSTESGDGKILTSFQPTLPMSTYLVAFVLSDFECVSNADKTFNTCSSKKSYNGIKFIQSVGEKALPLLTQYTGIQYTLPKLDNYLIPDAESGGMENWGLIIYRENNALVNDNAAVATKRTAAELIIHELSHQWFGNLVTPVWWKYVWLKEGLSLYFQFYIANKIFPDWDMMNMFVARILQSSAFTMDATTHYNYLNWNPKSPIEIKSQFSTMTYHKGSVIMHMLNNILTEEVFQEGVRKYLKDHQFNVTSSDDFWKAMQIAHDNSKPKVNIKIKDVMEPWVEQKGYPVVKVVRNYETGTATFTQNSNLASEPSNKWCVPINYVTNSEPSCSCMTPSHWLKPIDQELIIEDINKDDWLLVNRRQSGYYRVDYDTENWKKITEFLIKDDYKMIHVLNRGQVINDLFYMATNDRQNLTTFLELTKYLSREVDLIPWRHAINSFKSMKRKIVDQKFHSNLKQYFLILMKKVIEEVGFEERSTDSYMMKKTRSEILPFACELGHTECNTIASNKLLAYLENPGQNPIPPNLENWILCSGANGTKIETLLQKKIENGESKYIKYLGCAKNKTYLRQYIETALTNASIPKNNVRMALGYIADFNVENWDYAVDYYIKNFNRIEKFLNQTHSTSSTLNDYIYRTPTADRMEKISEFVDKNDDRLAPWIKTAIPQQLKKLEWSKVNAPILNAWLEKETDQTPASATA